MRVLSVPSWLNRKGEVTGLPITVTMAVSVRLYHAALLNASCKTCRSGGTSLPARACSGISMGFPPCFASSVTSKLFTAALPFSISEDPFSSGSSGLSVDLFLCEWFSLSKSISTSRLTIARVALKS